MFKHQAEEIQLSRFQPHTIGTAPGKGREILEGVKRAYGFVPNLTANWVEAPATARAVAGTQRDEAFETQAWKAPTDAAA